jgi:subtilisin family serine protease
VALILMVVSLEPVLAGDAIGQLDKLTPRAARVLGSGSTETKYKLWLHFDSTRISASPVTLSEKALRRRAKVDPENYLIDSRDYTLADDVVQEIRASGVTVRRVSRWLKAVSIEAAAAEVEALSAVKGLVKIDLVNVFQASGDWEAHDAIPDQSLYVDTSDYGPSLRQTRFVRALKLHDAGLSGKGVLIAIFDSGFNDTHPAFDSTSIVATWDFINDREAVDGADCPGELLNNHQDHHGTLSLGVAGGYAPGNLIGPAYGADFALAKTEITCGGVEIKIEEDNWIAAAEWADSLGADIISASLGYHSFQDTTNYTTDELDGNTALITIAADIAASKNILVVNSAGNERNSVWGTIMFPADGDSVLAVGAVDAQERLALFSSPGPTADGRIKPDIVTLGIGVYSAHSLTGAFTTASGTSLSAPLVSGGAALALEHDSTLTAMELLELIRSTGSMSANPNNDFGYGLYDATSSADIVKVDPVGRIDVNIGATISVPITASGRSNVTPELYLVDPPDGVELDDFGDGSGLLRITGMEENEGNLGVAISADVGFFVDTTYFVLYTYGGVLAGPNPFKDTLFIYTDVPAGTPGSRLVVSVFNSAGEKVREIVNTPAFSTDVVVWDGRNSYGRVVAPGVYLVHVETSRSTRWLKLLKLE